MKSGARPKLPPRAMVRSLRVIHLGIVLRRIFSSSDGLVSGGARDYSLDGIRAIAALWVFATHATYLNLMPPILNFRGAGRAGVVLFFFLSAFLH